MSHLARLRASVLVLVLVSPACRASSNVIAQDFDVTVTVNRDGSADIHERVELTVASPSPATIHLASPEFRNDGLSGMAVVVDNVPVGPAVLQIPTGSHVLTRTYRAKNVVWISGIRGTVLWRAVPADRDFRIEKASISMTVPDDAVLLDDPWTDESGWTVKRLAHGMAAERIHDFATGETGTAGVEFTIDRMTAARPQWQFDQDVAEEYIPAFVSAGLFILVVGVGIVFMIRARFGVSEPGSDAAARMAAARDLRNAGWVVLASGAASAVFVHMTLQRFEGWPMAIPISLLLVGVIFLVAGTRMLYFARVPDGRISA